MRSPRISHAFLFSAAGSITNNGAIGSLDGGRAIVFQGSDTHTLTLDTGSQLNGNVQGGSGTDNLVLLGTGAGTMAKFLGFENLPMQGTDWTLIGNGTSRPARRSRAAFCVSTAAGRPARSPAT